MTPDISPKTAVRWMPDYAVGVEEIDHEHQRLFVLAGAFHVAMREGKGKEKLDELLVELIDYACSHFEHEEQLMERIDYPYYLDHCAEHRHLQGRVAMMRRRADAGETSVTVELMQFLIDWLKCHTTTSDRRIGTYMRKRGMTP